MLAVALLAGWQGRALLSPPFDSTLGVWVFTSVVIVSALLCYLRGVLVGDERFAWLMMGLGLTFWAAGEVYFDNFLPKVNPPFPSPADAAYLAFYGPVCVALWSLAKSRIRTLSSALWLNGLVGALAVATLTALLVFEPLVRTTRGSPAVVATTLAYPLADLVLLGMLATVFGMAGWRIGPSYALVFVGLICFRLSDLDFLLANADGGYVAGRIFDSGWPLGAILLAFSAWQRPRCYEAARRGPGPRWSLLAPMLCAAGIVALLLYADYHRRNTLAQALAAVTLVCVLMRVWQVFTSEQNMARQIMEERERRVSSRLEAAGQLAAGIAHEINTPLAFYRWLGRVSQTIRRRADGGHERVSRVA
jgi:signal transduction histidine kinase